MKILLLSMLFLLAACSAQVNKSISKQVVESALEQSYQTIFYGLVATTEVYNVWIIKTSDEQVFVLYITRTVPARILKNKYLFGCQDKGFYK